MGEFVSMAGGWKKDKDGRKYLSCKTDSMIELFAVYNGKTYRIEYFNGFIQDRAKGKQPNVKFMVGLDERNEITDNSIQVKEDDDVPF